MLSEWDWNPVVLAVCGVAILGYGAAFRFRWPRKVWFLIAAIGVVLLALVSPIEALSNGYLFSAHMTQHLLLQLVVPPLLLLSLPVLSRPESFRTGRWRWADRLLQQRFLTWTLGLGAMWIWHERSLCDASTSIPWVHTVQVISLVLLGGLFWWPILAPWPEHHIEPLLGAVYLFTACLGCTVLGIIITFAPVGVCPIYLHPVDRLGILPLVRNHWGFSPGVDQQVGGLLMWVPACLIYLTGVMGMLARWYGGEYANDVIGPANVSSPTAKKHAAAK